ncbi:MAG TPA: hypothetical protein DD379_24190 [Cyanobacteria bacterium UBA11162]|nr:hypothetical protein [Cyanobacteria bacterium UBA12227]HAX89552.1 hypothetical protein [Cyanobacteria bacterium UBA11370]HBL14431.1 hypothetical protein [Cyanobacteria bacterium UBA11162]HBY81103.1 hypothetical protein [Cyanobacteria bacterium UBA11148]
MTKSKLNQRLHPYKERIKVANQKWKNSRSQNPQTLLPGEYLIGTDKGTLKIIVRPNEIEIQSDEQALTIEQLSDCAVLFK